MDIFKIGLFSLILLVILYGCNGRQDSGLSSRERQKLIRQYDEIRKEKDAAIENTVRQLQNINHVYEQVEAINLEMSGIRINMKNREVAVPMTQMEMIDSLIVNIKNEVENLESKNRLVNEQNRELAKTITYLKGIIEGKENERRFAGTQV